jgi:hypothetical protein
MPGVFSAVKRLGRGHAHPLPSIDEFKNENSVYVLLFLLCDGVAR